MKPLLAAPHSLVVAVVEMWAGPEVKVIRADESQRIPVPRQTWGPKL